jgi:hypothetical protein
MNRSNRPAAPTNESRPCSLVGGGVGLPPRLKISPRTDALTGTGSLGDAAGSPSQTVVTATCGISSTRIQRAWAVTTPLTLTNHGNTLSYVATGLLPRRKIKPEVPVRGLPVHALALRTIGNLSCRDQSFAANALQAAGRIHQRPRPRSRMALRP